MGITLDRVAILLHKLQSHDLIDLDQACEQIQLAYPFTESATEHRVELNGHAFHALCAIDALGVADMYGADTTISSPCHHCGETIHLRTTSKGRALHSVSPASTVIWYDFAYDGSAAASCCPAIAFFCTNEHLQQWLNAQTPRRDGVRPTVDEALEVGRAIFGPILVEQRYA
ncbi:MULTISPECIES: alkylmercury lyase family protein [unclassified Afipia]|uniref:alkylmercury lyase family protein n=1 Tax=unclassified Afipia TaxID=2642050 RepID=UPI001FCBF2C6|nr:MULTISPECIES: alkylmercury lyase family protein [unclassified Afipia]